jgi:histidine triad (HIT) family protein
VCPTSPVSEDLESQLFTTAKWDRWVFTGSIAVREFAGWHSSDYPMTLFEQIINRKIPANIIKEDENLIVFHDNNPQAPVHVLVVPKRAIPRITATDPQDVTLLGNLLLAAQNIAKELGIAASGFRIVINSGSHGGETVPHLHLHVLGGRPFHWPPG